MEQRREEVILADKDVMPFPRLPPFVQQPAADSTIKHVLSRPRNSLPVIGTSALIHEAWALVTGRVTNSENVMFAITALCGSSIANSAESGKQAFAAVPIHVSAAKSQNILTYLTGLQRGAIESTPPNICNYSLQTLIVAAPEDQLHTLDRFSVWQVSNHKEWCREYALVLSIEPDVEDIMVAANFDPRVIDPRMLQKMLERLGFVMYQLSNMDPKQFISGLDMATPQDLEEIWKWNGTVQAPVERLVDEIIEEQVHVQADAPAVCAWDGELSYGELDRFAARLPVGLAELGAQPGVLVALCFEESMWTTIAILVVLKTGAGFVLFDPLLPKKRLRDIIQQASVRLLVSSSFNKNLSSQLVQDVITIGAGFFEEVSDELGRRFQRPSPSSGMLVVFTFGSKGHPRGSR